VVYFPKPGELGRDPRDAGELERDAGAPGELLITLKLSRCEKILEEALGELADGIARELVWIKRNRDVADTVSRTTSSASDDLEAGAPGELERDAGAPGKKERQNS
jgi:hypothetical protein